MYNNYMNGYNPGYGTGYNQNNYGNYGMMQSQIPTQSIAQTSLQGMQTGQGYNSTLLTHKMASECFLWAVCLVAVGVVTLAVMETG